MSSCLHSFVQDLVHQISDSNEWLDQRHYRLLLNLPAIEKVQSHAVFFGYVFDLICLEFLFCIASISKVYFGVGLECWQSSCYEIFTKIEYFEYVRLDCEQIQ